MTGRLLFLTHPEVMIDREVPVPDWPLSPLGRARTRLFAPDPVLAAVTCICCSTERKAIDTAEILGLALGLPWSTHEALGENDRSATGFLPPDEFERTADRFFAQPETSIRGWERAADAQRRVVGEVIRLEVEAPVGDLLIVAHGGVGALLLAHALGQPISRAYDQTGQGGGNYILLQRPDLRVIQRWQPIPRPAA